MTVRKEGAMSTTRAGTWRMAVVSLAAVVGVTVAAMRLWGARDAPESGRWQSGRTGVRAYIDPETGELGVPPAGTAAPSVRATSRRLANLVEVPSTGAAGGVMINMKGHLAADVVATADAGGKTTVQCLPHTADASASSYRE